ncbi:peptidase M50B-like-domain-containing protein [Melampsora americana]|nr:peptidase M50B-like-domain-containing protein [Melampsora americana]
MLTRFNQINRRKRRRIITSVHSVFFTFTLLLPLVLSADSYSHPGPQLQFQPHNAIKPPRLITWFESFFRSQPKSTLDLSLTLRGSHSEQKKPSPPTPCSTQYLDQHPLPLQTAPPSAYAPYYGPGYLTKPRDELDPPDALPTQPALVHQPGSPAFRALGRRWAGYATVTVFVNTITITAGALQVVTVTVGDSGPQGGGTVTVTVAGATQTVGAGGNVVVVGPQTTSTQTVFMTPTPTIIHSTSTITIGAGGSVATGIAKPGDDYDDDKDKGLASDRPCHPGEDSLRYPGTLAPTNPTQTSTLFAIGVYFVFILVSWNLYIIRQIIYPIKLLVVAWHEFGHVVACACSGARLDSVTIDPNEGGATRMEAQIYPAAGLPAGYISSFFFGGIMIFCGFNTLASKVASFIIGMSLVVVFWWASGLMTRILTLGAVGLMIGFWFIDHAGILRYFVLFIGVMSSWYVLFDVMDDFVFRKMNPCCPVMFEERFPMVKAGIWALIWTVLAAINFVAWILLSLAVWRGTPRGMYCQSQQFLPT